MFSEYDIVRIKVSGIEGEIVDIAKIQGEYIFVVEGTSKVPDEDGNGESWPLFQCRENEIEKV